MLSSLPKIGLLPEHLIDQIKAGKAIEGLEARIQEQRQQLQQVQLAVEFVKKEIIKAGGE